MRACLLMGAVGCNSSCCRKPEGNNLHVKGTSLSFEYGYVFGRIKGMLDACLRCTYGNAA